MNAKLLFAATLTLAVASSFAQAADNTLPLTRADGKAEEIGRASCRERVYSSV